VRHAAWRSRLSGLDAATWAEAKQQTNSAPAAKRQLAAVRMLFDWLITS